MRGAHAWKMPSDKIAGKIHVPAQNLAQLIEPNLSVVAIGANERVHGEHIHGVVMTEGRFLSDAVAQPGIVNDVVAANKAGKVKCFRRRIERDCALTRILAH